ncbi:MAG: ABC transporter ATP-binding protein [Pseudomonadales bacterium]|nr:ABC transporter ATP-binding protein [Pseudomonadales bacterium]
MTMLEFKDTGFWYEEEFVLQSINTQFNSGEMVGLIGPNGAGKSTLLKLIMGAIKPNEGSVLLYNKPVSTYKTRALAQQVSLVPQDTNIGYAFTVEEIVAMGRNPHLGRFEVPSDCDQDLIAQALKQTGLQKLAERHVNTLSGGERQRVLVARAIAQQTHIVLFDEATANLDICHQLDVLTLAKTLANNGRLVICAIHDLNMAARFCDRLILLANKTIQADGIPSHVLTTPLLRNHFSIDAEIQTQKFGISERVQITPKSLHRTPITP